MRRPFRVLIVGGGTAGWMAASYFARMLKDQVEIRVVESPAIPTVGVGEASFRSLKAFFDALGISEESWMPRCQATYKMAIRFANWSGDGEIFHHPFELSTSIGGASLLDWWLKVYKGSRPFDDACFVVPTLCSYQRAPRFLDGRVFDQPFARETSDDHEGEKLIGPALWKNSNFPYGYHFDASQLAVFLAEFAQELDVSRTIDTVSHVGLDASGDIDYVCTEAHGRLKADLYVDCTGFRGLLIDQMLAEPHISYADRLPNDSAVATQIPYESAVQELDPFTSATALNAGWAWHIPLYRRAGVGYVYSSEFLSADEAEKELRDHLGPRSSDLKLSHIKMRIGRARNSWTKNCVALGLASGFVEPLESTGIFFIQHGIEELVNHFPFGPDSDTSRLSYNKIVNECMDGVAEFLAIHYVASKRADTDYWRSMRSMAVSSELRDRLKIWSQYAPTRKNIKAEFHGFQAYSYACILYGLGYFPTSPTPIPGGVRMDAIFRAFERKRELAAALARVLPSHRTYLSQRVYGD